MTSALTALGRDARVPAVETTALLATCMPRGVRTSRPRVLGRLAQVLLVGAPSEIASIASPENVIDPTIPFAEAAIRTAYADGRRPREECGRLVRGHLGVSPKCF